MACFSPLSIPAISHGLRTPRIFFKNSGQLRFLGYGHGVLKLNHFFIRSSSRQILDGEIETESLISKTQKVILKRVFLDSKQNNSSNLSKLSAVSCAMVSWLSFVQGAESSVGVQTDAVYEIAELFELGIQLSYLLILLGLLGIGTFYVIRQVLVRRELDLSAKELQEQVRSGDASATEYFELGAVMLRRKFYPAAIKYLQQAIEKWDRDDQDLAQIQNDNFVRSFGDIFQALFSLRAWRGAYVNTLLSLHPGR